MNEIASVTPDRDVLSTPASSPMAELYGALARAQLAFKDIPKNGFVEIRTRGGDEYGFHYATLDCIREATKQALSENGLSVFHTMRPHPSDAEKVLLVTFLTHEGGGVVESVVPTGGPGPDPKQFGSRLTYLRRYMVSALLGVTADEDNDGAEAAGDTVRRKEEKPLPKAAPQSGSMQEHARSLPPRQSAPVEGFKLIGPDGQEHTATARDGNSALVVWMSWFRAALKSPNLGTADALRNWFVKNERYMDAIERASADAFSAARQAYTARYAELDDSFPIKSKPELAAAK